MKKNNGNILIVDDNEEALIALKMLLSKYFTKVTSQKNPNLILSHLSKYDYDVVVLDMNFSAGINTGNEGIFWMKKILEKAPETLVVLLTAYGDVDLAVKALKEGGADFLQKPWDNDKLLATVVNAWKLRQSKKEILNLRDKQQHLAEDIDEQFKFFVGVSPAMKKVWATVGKIASTDANVLILGENGTGKEIVARELHRRSLRKAGIFVKVDMGSIPKSLFESELFGHTKGAFTDAGNDKPGRFEIASGGTLFLDEIGNLPITMQPKILAALQNREIIRLGSNRTVPINIRLLSATNMPLGQMVREGNFRDDLLYRINTIQLQIPPLRNRKEDISGLLQYFLEKYKKKYCKPDIKTTSQVVGKLMKYDWPGNIREFENMVEKAVILSDDNLLKPKDFIFQPEIENNFETEDAYNLEGHEKKIIAKALAEFNYNHSKAADRLGITRATLYRKIQKYEI